MPASETHECGCGKRSWRELTLSKGVTVSVLRPPAASAKRARSWKRGVPLVGAGHCGRANPELSRGDVRDHRCEEALVEGVKERTAGCEAERAKNDFDLAAAQRIRRSAAANSASEAERALGVQCQKATNLDWNALLGVSCSALLGGAGEPLTDGNHR
jgi:hypothetical protein